MGLSATVSGVIGDEDRVIGDGWVIGDEDGVIGDGWDIGDGEWGYWRR